MVKSFRYSEYDPPRLQVKSHTSYAQNLISRFTQIVEQQLPLTSLIFI